MKRTVLIVLLVVVLGAVSVNAQSYVVGLSVSTLNNPFFVDLKEGAEEAAAELGLTLIATDAQNDANRQLSSVEDLISRGVDILIINPVDSSAIVPAIRTANNANPCYYRGPWCRWRTVVSTLHPIMWPEEGWRRYLIELLVVRVSCGVRGIPVLLLLGIVGKVLIFIADYKDIQVVAKQGWLIELVACRSWKTSSGTA